jgi:Anti-sigma-K factor rskA
MARVEQPPQQPVDTVLDTDPVDLASRRPGRGLLLAAAAVMLAGIAGVLGVQLNKVERERRAQTAEQAKVLSVITDPSMHRAVLTGGNGQQVAVLLSSDKGAAVVPSGLQPNDPANQTYVIWGTSADKPVALSKFDVTAAGAGPATVDWSAAAAAHHGFAISLEPGRGLPVKPTTVVATGQVTS